MKKNKHIPKPSLTLEINGVTVVPKEAESSENVCPCCCFSFEGRAQRDCPKCVTGNTQRNLCTVIQTGHNGKYTYFKEV